MSSFGIDPEASSRHPEPCAGGYLEIESIYVERRGSEECHNFDHTLFHSSKIFFPFGQLWVGTR